MRMTAEAIILGATMVISILLPASGQIEGGASETVPGQEERAWTDFSALPNKVRARLQELDGKYGTSAWRNFENTGLISAAEMGSSKVVRDGSGNLLYRQNLLKGVYFRDDKGNGYDLTYYPDGRVNSYVEHDAGGVCGAVVKFHPNGKLKYQMEYAGGDQAGEVGQWDDSGNFIGSNAVPEPLSFIVNVSTNE